MRLLGCRFRHCFAHPQHTAAAQNDSGELNSGGPTSIVPQPLTYLAGASLSFLLSVRFARAFASFVFLRNFNSISFDLPLKEISVSACLLAVIPTVLGLYCLARLVALAAGPTKVESTVSSITSVILGLELYLFSVSLVAGRLVTLLAVDHEVTAGLYGLCCACALVDGTHLARCLISQSVEHDLPAQ